MAAPFTISRHLKKTDLRSRIGWRQPGRRAVPQWTQYLVGSSCVLHFPIGAGVEHYIFIRAIRAQGDYLHTTFANSTDQFAGQNNLLLTTSIVYRFGRTAE